MKLLIVETDEIIVDTIKKIIAKRFKDHEITGVARTIKEALQCCIKVKPDILIMDIIIGNMLSLELLDYIEPETVAVIILCTHKDFAVNTIKFNTVEYLMKPLQEQVFINTFEKVIMQSEQINSIIRCPLPLTNTTDEFIDLTEKHFKRTFKLSSLIKIHSDGSYSKVFFTGGKTMHLSKNLKYFENLLINHGFIRKHKTVLVNKSNIIEYIPGKHPKIILSDGSRESLSRTKKQEIIKLLGIVEEK